MKIIDRNGRLFGVISVIDLLVIAVVAVMAAALYFKSNQPHTGTTVTEQPITFQIRARGLRSYVAQAIQVGDHLYDLDYTSGGASLGEIVDIQVERDPGTALVSLHDGTVQLIEAEDSVDLLITVQGMGLVDGKNYSINRVYALAVNSARGYYTRMCQFTGTVVGISAGTADSTG